MRLKNYGPGELSDRLTILSLKILFGTEAGREVKHFEHERAALLTEIRTKTLNGVWFDSVLELGAVNGALWHAEDQLRAVRPPHGVDFDPSDVSKLAFRIQALNDRRAALIESINRAAGELLGSEKVSP